MAATALACPTSLVATPNRWFGRERSLGELSQAIFEGQLHTSFRVTDAPVGQVELRLIEASVGETRHHERAVALDAEYEKFSLIFRGPYAPLLEHARSVIWNLLAWRTASTGTLLEMFDAKRERPIRGQVRFRPARK